MELTTVQTANLAMAVLMSFVTLYGIAFRGRFRPEGVAPLTWLLHVAVFYLFVSTGFGNSDIRTMWASLVRMHGILIISAGVILYFLEKK